MKKLYYILVVMLMAAGCESTLDLEPKNAVTFDHYFQDERSLEALVAQMNSDLRTALNVMNYHKHIGMNVDRVNGSSDRYDKVRRLDPTVIANRVYQQQWKPYYNVLYLTDLFLDNYKRAEGVSQKRADFYLGQCYFIRAVCYMRLAQIWGDAVITKGSNYVDKYAKSPASEVVDTAIVSAEKAYKLLPKYSDLKNSSGKALTSKQYGCKGSAAGVLVHLNTWKGTVLGNAKALEEAERWAGKLLDPTLAAENGTYLMAADPEEVCTKALGRRGDESVFEVEISYTDNTTYPPFVPAYYMLGWPVLRNEQAADIVDATYGIYVSSVNAMYEQGDLRRTAYFYEPDVPGRNPADLAYLYKWRTMLYRESSSGQATFINIDANEVLIRLADIYLLRAECRAKLGNVQGAAEDLNVVRRRAAATEYPDARNDENSQNGLVWAIFRERERELLFEGERYYDVVRNYYYDQNFLRELPEEFPVLTGNEVKNGAFYLPVPESAFRYNDLMIQNTYWLSKMQ